jgi:inhibitor of cysteine peptidase
MSKGKILIWVGVVLVIVVLAISGWLIYLNYYNNSPNPPKIQISEDQQNVTLKMNQELTITLSSNKTTGYSWQLNNSYDKNVIKLISNDYVAPNSELMGAPGQELWNFKSIDKGSTTVQLDYSRSWSKDTTPLNKKSFNITVN